MNDISLFCSNFFRYFLLFLYFLYIALFCFSKLRTFPACSEAACTRIQTASLKNQTNYLYMEDIKQSQRSEYSCDQRNDQADYDHRIRQIVFDLVIRAAGDG